MQRTSTKASESASKSFSSSARQGSAAGSADSNGAAALPSSNLSAPKSSHSLSSEEQQLEFLDKLYSLIDSEKQHVVKSIANRSERAAGAEASAKNLVLIEREILAKIKTDSSKMQLLMHPDLCAVEELDDVEDFCKEALKKIESVRLMNGPSLKRHVQLLSLPPEVLESILLNLSATSLILCGFVSQRFRSIVVPLARRKVDPATLSWKNYRQKMMLELYRGGSVCHLEWFKEILNYPVDSCTWESKENKRWSENTQILHQACAAAAAGTRFPPKVPFTDYSCLEGHKQLLQYICPKVDGWASACAGAVRGNNVPLLQWLFGQCQGVEPWNLCAREAARTGNVAILQLLEDRGAKFRDLKIIEAAAEGGHVEVLKWFSVREHPMPDFMYEIIAEFGHRELFDWLREKRPVPARYSFVLARYGRFEWLKTLVAAGSVKFPLTREADYACASGNLELIRWCEANGGRVTVDAWTFAGENCQLHILKWLHSRSLVPDDDKVRAPLFSAGAAGRLDILKWILATLRKGKAKWTGLVHEAIVEAGQLEVLKWWRDNTLPEVKKTCPVAAKNGELEVLKWAYANGCKWDATKILKEAQCNGARYVEIIKWVEKHRVSPFFIPPAPKKGVKRGREDDEGAEENGSANETDDNHLLQM